MQPDQKTIEATLAEIEQLCKEKGDSLIIKVNRREDDSAFGLAQVWAIFEQCKLSHVAFRESWLNQITGSCGGAFELAVYHVSATMRQIGVSIPTLMKRGRVAPPNFAVMDDEKWEGPKVLKFPDRNPAPQPQQPIARTDGSSFSLPPPSQNGNVSQQDVNNAGRRGSSDADVNRLLDAAAQLAKQKDELAEQRHRFELQSMQQAFEARLTALTNQLQSKPTAPVTPPPTIIDQATQLIPLVTPLVAIFMDRSEKRDAQTLALAEKAEERNRALLLELKEAFAKKADGNTEVSQMYAKMAESMGAMANVSFQIMHQAKETMGAAEPENPMIEVVGRLADVVQTLGTKYLDVASKRPTIPIQSQPGKQLPAQTTANAPQQQQQNAAQPNPVEEMEKMIRDHVDVNRVADFFFEILNTNEMQIALTQVGGDPTDLMKVRLGAWLLNAENYAYAMSLAEAITAGAVKRGYKDEAEQPKTNAAPPTPTPTPTPQPVPAQVATFPKKETAPVVTVVPEPEPEEEEDDEVEDAEIVPAVSVAKEVDPFD